MSSNNSNSFTVNFYLDGLPVVLNQQRLKLRLRDSRITRRERLDVEVALASPDGSGFLTLADHEDDKPLLFRLIPKGDRFSVMTILKGEYDEGYLTISNDARHIVVRDASQSSQFTLSIPGVQNAKFSDLDKGPVNVVLAAGGSKAIYHAQDNGKHHFKDVEPNTTGHDAYNNKPALFVVKIVERPE
ncbi:hypothetical protein [Pseudomonas atagonensis]|uniref:hypothetical protein n=1 Tax=Pseudomonas atagonensis TaxID=2609964 RepID=UPI00140B0B77|nr:hypothetical protein [Pseudomonas atagonensis]